MRNILVVLCYSFLTGANLAIASDVSVHENSMDPAIDFEQALKNTLIPQNSTDYCSSKRMVAVLFIKYKSEDVPLSELLLHIDRSYHRLREVKLSPDHVVKVDLHRLCYEVYRRDLFDKKDQLSFLLDEVRSCARNGF